VKMLVQGSRSDVVCMRGPLTSESQLASGVEHVTPRIILQKNDFFEHLLCTSSGTLRHFSQWSQQTQNISSSESSSESSGESSGRGVILLLL
jgi:hypothetical protein